MTDQPTVGLPNSHVDERTHGQPLEILPKDRLPPELESLRKWVLWVARFAMIAAVCFLVYICTQFLLGDIAVPACACWTYIALSVFLIGLVVERWLLHDRRVHEARTEDQSEINALIQEATNVKPRLSFDNENGHEENRPLDFENLKKQLVSEVKRLRDLGPGAWTDYQILPLNQLLIDFLPIEDLKARARSSLLDLEDYAIGEAFSYDAKLYNEWAKRIDEDIKAIDNWKENRGTQDSVADNLRADLRSLFEHVADYESNWARGKTIVNSIRLCGSAAVLVFMVMGLLEVIYPVSDIAGFPRLGIFNWGFLGIAGAITSVLLALRKSDEVEVGNTRGFQELWRAVLGAILGFVAGILIFSALSGGVIEGGGAVPNLAEMQLKDVYLSIMWAVVSGMGFESVFQRVRSAASS